jgi:hypothetical protein
MTDALADHLREHRRWNLPSDLVRIEKGERFGLCPQCSKFGLYLLRDMVVCRYCKHLRVSAYKPQRRF